jgi:hypothetical protein
LEAASEADVDGWDGTLHGTPCLYGREFCFRTDGRHWKEFSHP